MSVDHGREQQRPQHAGHGQAGVHQRIAKDAEASAEDETSSPTQEVETRMPPSGNDLAAAAQSAKEIAEVARKYKVMSLAALSEQMINRVLNERIVVGRWRKLTHKKVDAEAGRGSEDKKEERKRDDSDNDEEDDEAEGESEDWKQWIWTEVLPRLREEQSIRSTLRNIAEHRNGSLARLPEQRV